MAFLLKKYTLRNNTTNEIQHHVGADIIAIDILEEADGTQHIVEYNDILGLSGFPDALKFGLASLLKAKAFKAQG